MFALFSRTRRRAPVLRPYLARLTVERLEGRDAPSSLDVTSLTSPSPTDSTTTSDTAVLSPAPTVMTDTTSTVTAVPVVVSPAPAPVSPLPQAGDILPAPTTPLALPALKAPVLQDPADLGDWNYSVSGTVEDPNPAALTAKITVDDNPVGSAAVKALTNPDGTPNGQWGFTVTFGLPACTSATNATRYGTAVTTAVTTAGTRTSPPALFMIEQTPVTSATLLKTL